MPQSCRLLTLILILCFVITATDTRAGELHDAASAGDTDRVRALIDAGADIDEQRLGTPLYYASRDGRFEIAELLIKRGADVNAKSKYGAPLHIASRKGYQKIVKLLLENGADTDLTGGEYDTVALHNAAQGGHADIVSMLLDSGADPNISAKGRGKAPPIHYAAKRGHFDIVKLLRARGARPNPVTPITRKELESANLDLGRARAKGCTPCHTYSEAGKFGSEGPSLWNVVGRKIASEPDANYSKLMKEMDGIWTYEALNQFLADVRGTVPGTGMYFGDEPDRATRIALIAYLRTMADEPYPLPH